MAASSNKVFVGDVGTIIYVNVREDISAASIMQLKVFKPVSGREVIWDGVLEGTTKIKYIVQEGDFNEAGEYKVQAYVELPAWRGRGETATFRVYDKFEQ